jgi:hypothetical protein
MTTDNICYYLQNRLIQTSQTGGQQYSDTSPFSIPWCNREVVLERVEKRQRMGNGKKRERDKKGENGERSRNREEMG